MFKAYPVSALQLGLFWAIVAVGAVALVGAFRATRGQSEPAKRSSASILGIAIQGISFALAGAGPLRLALPWLAPSSIACSVLVVLLGGSAIALFIAARRAMGANWSVVARTRSDHQLVRSGPFSLVRHPIYLALLLYLLSLGIAFGHLGQLAAAIPIYMVGAAVRIRAEEKLLRAQFGDAHARYVREVPAFIPFVL